MADLPRVLCVDDEPQVLQGLVLHLRRHFQVTTAGSGAAALKILEEAPAPAVIVSDMRMPQMDGAALLKRVFQDHPETTRILLTGEPSRDSAATAVNEGRIFRFLTKPCSPDELRAAVDAGVTQHRVLKAEKVLMQETLLGCIHALTDVLAMTNPVAFGRTNRVTRMASELAAARGMTGFWQLEAAAMLSQIGFISLPPPLVEKLYYGQRLSAAEQLQADAAPGVAQTLLGRIPRIEPVMQILAQAQAKSPPSGHAAHPNPGADILRLVLDFDALVASGTSAPAAAQALRGRAHAGNPALTEALVALVAAGEQQQSVRDVVVELLKPGMIMQDDLRTSVGTLLVPKGFEVTEAFLERRRNFDPSILQAKVRVIVPLGLPLSAPAD